MSKTINFLCFQKLKFMEPSRVWYQVTPPGPFQQFLCPLQKINSRLGTSRMARGCEAQRRLWFVRCAVFERVRRRSSSAAGSLFGRAPTLPRHRAAQVRETVPRYAAVRRSMVHRALGTGATDSDTICYYVFAHPFLLFSFSGFLNTL